MNWKIGLILLLAITCTAQQATIQGYVRDGNSGKSMPDVPVEVFSSQDHVNIISTTITDENGFYSVTVEPGNFYDVYLRLGETNPNQRTSQSVQPNSEYTINFNIASVASYSDSVVDKYGFGLVLAVAAIILGLILFDRFSSKKQRQPDMAELSKERDEILERLEITKSKYHKREIDEESYREITRDQQERLIVLESKIKKEETPDSAD